MTKRKREKNTRINKTLHRKLRLGNTNPTNNMCELLCTCSSSDISYVTHVKNMVISHIRWRSHEQEMFEKIFVTICDVNTPER